MAETARVQDDRAPGVDGPKPSLQLVPPGRAGIEPGGDGPRVGRSALVGYLIGFVVVTVGITVAGTLGGLGFGDSLGLGAFVGFWGGGGFGFMLGATATFARQLERRSTVSMPEGRGHGSRSRRP
jgi:hypothetical protein